MVTCISANVICDCFRRDYLFQIKFISDSSLTVHVHVVTVHVCNILPGRHVHLSNVSLNRVQVICKLVAGVTMHNKLQDTEGEGR